MVSPEWAAITVLGKKLNLILRFMAILHGFTPILIFFIRFGFTSNNN